MDLPSILWGEKQVVLIIHIDGSQVLVSINMNQDGYTQYFVGEASCPYHPHRWWPSPCLHTHEPGWIYSVFCGGKQVVLIIHIDGSQVLVSIHMNLDGSTQYFVGGEASCPYHPHRWWPSPCLHKHEPGWIYPVFCGGKQVVLIIHIDGSQVLVSINMNLDGSTQYFVGGGKLSLSSTSMVAKSLSP